MELMKKVEATRHFGSEYLTWLLYTSTRGDGEITLADGSVVEVWFEDKVKMVSPIATKEVDLFKGKSPAHSNEALEALRDGKVIEEASLIIIKGDKEWKMGFNGPRWSYSSVKIPALLKEEEDDRIIERFWLLEELHGIMESLYKSFLEIRLNSTSWGDELTAIRSWLNSRD